MALKAGGVKKSVELANFGVMTTDATDTFFINVTWCCERHENPEKETQVRMLRYNFVALSHKHSGVATQKWREPVFRCRRVREPSTNLTAKIHDHARYAAP